MSKAPGSTVLRQIENGLTIQVIEVETDWTPDEITALATEEGYALTDDGTFRYLTDGPHLAIARQPVVVEVATETDDGADASQAVERIEAEGSPAEDAPAPSSPGVNDPVALIAAGHAHDYEDVQEAAAEVTAWLDILAERMIAAEANRAALAAVERAEQEYESAARALFNARVRAGLVDDAEQPVPLPPYDAKTVRAWAAEHGVDCPRTGRVPRAVLEAYFDAHEAGAA